MDLCEQCGSASRDKDGFCAGCGSRRPTLARSTEPPSQPAQSPLNHLSHSIVFDGLEPIRPKQVWLAILLATVSGPFGLFYCTTLGGVVMVVVSFVVQILLGRVTGYLLLLPVCIFWAWQAARESSSITDWRKNKSDR
ncbi:MAG: hypothetical protein WCD42_11930 [Rhizomicrobium sp.]